MGEPNSFDVLVVGAGPAGLAAAVRASESGRSVGLLDDNPDLGGQIWRGGRAGAKDGSAARWIDRALSSKITFLPSTQVVGLCGDRSLLVESGGGGGEVRYRRLILATGARELFLPFPGWTLPNVMGAGGLQALVKAGLPIRGKSVAIVGSGPLLLAVAASLRSKGADVRIVAEQARWSRVVGFGAGLWRSPSKLMQAIELRGQLGAVPVRFGVWPVRAEGDGVLRSVRLTDGKRDWSISCDYLACGFGLVPNVELADLLGGSTERGVVTVDELQRTTAGDIYCAGESTGIGGLDLSLVEGEVAGLAASGRESEARALFPARERAREFARSLERAFALRDELKTMAEADTVVCRCEDVRLGALRSHGDSLSAKLQTRCGMGPCQGRVCGPSTEFLLGWTRGSVRPPIFPTDLATLAERPEARAEPPSPWQSAPAVTD